MDPTKDKEAVFATSIYLMCLTLQIFTPCYCASTLTDKSDRLPGSIFYSRWWEQTKRFKSSMLIFTERAMKPIVPKAGGLFAVGLPIFVSVIVKFIFNMPAGNLKFFFICVSDHENGIHIVCGHEKNGCLKLEGSAK